MYTKGFGAIKRVGSKERKVMQRKKSFDLDLEEWLTVHQKMILVFQNKIMQTGGYV